ncbi:prepilin-type N-terminal cleavage/methylation domain-containing protein [Vibrio aquaticus]|uniref:Prepilin-type N-terminal cleavage/methylation domain-containing protein n=1 Tax=Vibrio aquaticus TaxID=2496559 RepID=A0A432CX67_9VIBR|nr:prepilin-type N-terminal cleavage/methylation domain-containing protein [Vibrio aquaticus]RTZ16510.1 prepilin-type N-terminal cleavage/methylation domain-containing protein [Vibrio aquaticus]
MTEHSLFSRSSGFTLVELIITILLLSIVSVTAYTRLPSISGYAIDGYCNELKSGIRRVQTQAMNDVAVSGAYRITSSNVAGTVLWSNPALNLNIGEDCTGPSCARLMTFTPEDNRRGISINSQLLTFDSMGRPVDADNPMTEFTISAPDGSREQVAINAEGYVSGC